MYPRGPLFFAPAVMLLLANCAADKSGSDDDAGLQANAHTTDSLTSNNVSINEVTYNESAIPAFIRNGQDKTIDDMKRFYNEVVIDQYSGHPSQDYLKVKFIKYAVTYFDLLRSEKAHELQYLTELTRDLVAVEKVLEAGFLYDCVAACRGKMGSAEYNELVSNAKIVIGRGLERFKNWQAGKVKGDSARGDDEVNRIIGQYERYLADLETLTIP